MEHAIQPEQGSGLNIGQAEKASGISAKMIRHYEGIGLIGKAARSDSGYRRYSDKDVHVLRFIHSARKLGFSIRQIGELLALWQDRRRASSTVKRLALAHIAELEAKIAEMQAMKATLEHLAGSCHGDGRPDCPILAGIEQGLACGHAIDAGQGHACAAPATAAARRVRRRST